MKIKYEFVTGEVTEVEVSAEWEAELKELGRLEYNNDHAETRRHMTLDVSMDSSDWLTDYESDPSVIVERKEEIRILYEAMEHLTEKQRDVIIKVCVEGMNTKEYAEINGISQSAAAHRINDARNILKKIF